MPKYVQGDLIKAFLNNEIYVIAHGCNCFNTMGNGIAKSIKENFPEVYALDLKTKKGDRSKLGTINYYQLPKTDKFVVNAYTQYTYWDQTDMLDYDAVESCMKLIQRKFTGYPIGFPKIGAGLARGNWDIIEEIISRIFKNEDLTIYYL